MLFFFIGTELFKKAKMSRKLIDKGTSGTSGILLSRITGLARDMLIARFLGGGSVMSAWVLAFRIPNTFRGFLGEGAATQALIPILGNTIHIEGKEKFRRDFGTMIATLAIILAVLCVLVSGVCLAIRPYFPVYRVHAALSLMPILMPYTFFVCLTSICAGVLNIFDKYFLPALTAMALNLCIIIALLIYYKASPESQLVNISWASLISGVLQLAWLFYLLKKEDAFSYPLKPALWKSPVVKEFFTLAIPRFIGAAAVQISSLMDSFMAIYISSFAAPALYFSERLVYFPIGIFAVSLGNVCLVSMTKHISENNFQMVIKDMRYGLKQIIYVTVPMAIFFIFYRHELLTILFGGNEFGSKSIDEAAWATLFYCFGIPSFCAMKIISSAFYSQKDTRTPVKVALWCILLNFIINLALMFPLKQGGIALGTVISSIVNCLALTYIFKKRHMIKEGNNEVMLCFIKIVISGVVSVLTSLLAVKLCSRMELFAYLNWKGILTILLGCFTFCIVYFFINYFMRSPEQRDWLLLITSKLRK